MSTKKNLLLTLFAALALVLGTVACSDDDEPTRDTGASDGSTSDGSTADTGAAADSAVPDSAPVLPDRCVEECADDDDCKVSETDIGATCSTDKRCAAAAAGCDGEAYCVAQWSGWVTACTDDDGCPGQVCIEDKGGVCATVKDGDCVAPATEYATKKMDGGDDVTVCANQQNNVCLANGLCGCANSDACAIATLPMCDAGVCKCTADPDSCGDNMKCQADGTCGCDDDAACTDLTTTPSCNKAAGTCQCTETSCGDNMQCLNGGCGCANDTGCAESPLGTVCDTATGVCGCGDATTDCGKTTQVYDGTELVCGN